MAFTESLLLQKGHFLSSPEKGHFFTLKKGGGGGAHAPIAPRFQIIQVAVALKFLLFNQTQNFFAKLFHW
jgi:hypothetical protein